LVDIKEHYWMGPKVAWRRVRRQDGEDWTNNTKWHNAVIKGGEWYDERVDGVGDEAKTCTEVTRIRKGNGQHPLLSVSKETREMALKYLVLLVDPTLPNGTHIYFNPKVDTICFPQVSAGNGCIRYLTEEDKEVTDIGLRLSTIFEMFPEGMRLIELLELRDL
jgi:hypothetical protein